MTWHEQHIELKTPKWNKNSTWEVSIIYQDSYFGLLSLDQSSSLDLSHQPGEERQWLKEEEKECSVIVMVNQTNSQIVNCSNKKTLLFSHIWSSQWVFPIGVSLFPEGIWRLISSYPVALFLWWVASRVAHSIHRSPWKGKNYGMYLWGWLQPKYGEASITFSLFPWKETQAPDHTYLQEWLGKMVKPGAKE